jgi:hypothetical protein
MQMLGGSPGGRCLRSVLLSFAQLGHGDGQVEEAGQQDGDRHQSRYLRAGA